MGEVWRGGRGAVNPPRGRGSGNERDLEAAAELCGERGIGRPAVREGPVLSERRTRTPRSERRSSTSRSGAPPFENARARAPHPSTPNAILIHIDSRWLSRGPCDSREDEGRGGSSSGSSSFGSVQRECFVGSHARGRTRLMCATEARHRQVLSAALAHHTAKIYV